jgi:hypothetical protein
VSEVALDGWVEDLLGPRVAQWRAVLIQQIHQLFGDDPGRGRKCDEARKKKALALNFFLPWSLASPGGRTPGRVITSHATKKRGRERGSRLASSSPSSTKRKRRRRWSPSGPQEVVPPPPRESLKTLLPLLKIRPCHPLAGSVRRSESLPPPSLVNAAAPKTLFPFAVEGSRERREGGKQREREGESAKK